jgi:thiosulfate/3-mercaptopyruvate sulfurtransferase
VTSEEATPSLAPPSPLVSPRELEPWLGRSDVRIVDCRFALADPEDGLRRYQTAHIPGAVYANLNRDLAGPVVPGKTGRHPLPDIETFSRTLGAWGISNEHFVIAYDQSDGSMAAARLWWLLRYVGHERGAVLDGGMNAWLAAGLPTHSGTEPSPSAELFRARARPELVATEEEVRALSQRRAKGLFDARAFQRFTGEVEPIDARAGHIPGAASLPFSTFIAGGKFAPAAEIRAGFEAALPSQPSDPKSDSAVAYCGSGVTACHLVLAANAAGRSDVRLYPGSFSEWIVDPDAPVETGS